MTEPSLHERAASLAGEIVQLKRDAALAGDDDLNAQLKPVVRILRSPKGTFTESAYLRLQERVANDLYDGVASEERAIQEKKEHLVTLVRGQVDPELADAYAQQEAYAAELEARATDVAAREREAKPSYRARFAAAGASVVLIADVLLRVIA
jgi:hypothetical protein